MIMGCGGMESLRLLKEEGTMLGIEGRTCRMSFMGRAKVGATLFLCPSVTRGGTSFFFPLCR